MEITVSRDQGRNRPIRKGHKKLSRLSWAGLEASNDGEPNGKFTVQFSIFKKTSGCCLCLEEQCATHVDVLQSRKTLSKKRKPSPIPAGALTLPNKPPKELHCSFDISNFSEAHL